MRVLHVGGGILSVPMLLEIKRRGFELWVIDGTPGCPGAGLADRFFEIDIYDLDTSFEVDLCLTTGTDAAVTAAVICEANNLPTIPVDRVKTIQNKALMRETLRLPRPRYNVRDYPCVVKAASSRASRGMTLVKNERQLADAISKARQFNTYDDNQVVVEELLIGENLLPHIKGFDSSEVSLDFFVDDKVPVYVNGCYRLFWKDTFIEAGHINPFYPDDEVMHLVSLVAYRLDITRGILKLDLKKDARYGWCVLETAARLSGGFDHSHTCPMATGKNITAAYLDFLLGNPYDLEPRRKAYAACFSPLLKDVDHNAERSLFLIDADLGLEDAWRRVSTHKIIFKGKEL